MTTREDRLRRILAGTNPEEWRESKVNRKSSEQRALAVLINNERTLSAPKKTHHKMEISDAAADLIAKAVKSLMGDS